MLSKHPNLTGIWAVWDVPAEGVMAAARASGRGDLKIATEDLGKNVAIALAKNELVVGLGAQVPFDQGVTEARLGAGALHRQEGAAVRRPERPAGRPTTTSWRPGSRSTTQDAPARTCRTPSSK